MALRSIVKYGDPILREKCSEVRMFNERLGIVIDDMKETMIKADGVGLAAPQIGMLRRICVVSLDGEEFYELVNPVIVKTSGTQCKVEGCLSIPGEQANIIRPNCVVVDAADRTGQVYRYKAHGDLARVFCHEIDHLDGILFIDREHGEGGDNE